MSGHMEIKIRPGLSKDPRYDNYLEWYLEVMGEDGKKTKLSPGFPVIRKMLVDILTHEYRNDATRDRNPDFNKKWLMLLKEESLLNDAQLTFDTTEIPEIYHEINEPKKAYKTMLEKHQILKMLFRNMVVCDNCGEIFDVEFTGRRYLERHDKYVKCLYCNHIQNVKLVLTYDEKGPILLSDRAEMERASGEI